jgi:sodium-coupled neutral amino acid transporter 11
MVAAIPLAFIIPAMCYIRLEEGPLLSTKKGPAVLLAAFGIIVSTCGIITIIAKVSTFIHEHRGSQNFRGDTF